MQPRILLDFSATSTHWLLFNLVSTRNLRSFSAKLLFRSAVPNTYWCMGLCLPRHRTLCFSLLNFMRCLSAHFSSLLRSLWMVAQPCSVSATPSGHVSSANFLRVQSASSSKSLMKMFNGIGSSMGPWRTLLFSRQLDFMPLITTLSAQPLS